MASIIISAVALVLSVAVLVYCVKLMVVYHRFNEQIVDWASGLDKKMIMSIDSAARDILRDLDSRVSGEENNEQKLENNG